MPYGIIISKVLWLVNSEGDCTTRTVDEYYNIITKEKGIAKVTARTIRKLEKIYYDNFVRASSPRQIETED